MSFRFKLIRLVRIIGRIAMNAEKVYGNVHTRWDHSAVREMNVFVGFSEK